MNNVANNVGRPVGDRVIVERTELEDTQVNGLFIPQAAQERPQEGLVVAVGNGRRLSTGELSPVDAQVGDKILFGKYAGTDVKINGLPYLILKEDEILVVL